MRFAQQCGILACNGCVVCGACVLWSVLPRFCCWCRACGCVCASVCAGMWACVDASACVFECACPQSTFVGGEAPRCVFSGWPPSRCARQRAPQSWSILEPSPDSSALPFFPHVQQPAASACCWPPPAGQPAGHARRWQAAPCSWAFSDIHIDIVTAEESSSSFYQEPVCLRVVACVFGGWVGWVWAGTAVHTPQAFIVGASPDLFTRACEKRKKPHFIAHLDV
jgi:hypothetical protein